MKRFYKISLITAAIFAAIGVVAVCIGLAMGGSLHDYNEIGIYYEDDGLKIYPQHREFEDIEEKWEEKWEHLEDQIEKHL